MLFSHHEVFSFANISEYWECLARIYDKFSSHSSFFDNPGELLNWSDTEYWNIYISNSFSYLCRCMQIFRRSSDRGKSLMILRTRRPGCPYSLKGLMMISQKECKFDFIKLVLLVLRFSIQEFSNFQKISKFSKNVWSKWISLLLIIF